jgi:hypothetical protein
MVQPELRHTNREKATVIVSTVGYGEPAAHAPTGVLVFAAVIASCNVQLPGSGASERLFTTIVAPSANVTMPGIEASAHRTLVNPSLSCLAFMQFCMSDASTAIVKDLKLAFAPEEP